MGWVAEPGGVRPPVIAVRGEPGIGKSRLLREFATGAEEHGWAVRWGRATEFERHVPFGVFTEALDASLRSVAPERLATLGEERTGMLAAAFPGLPGGAATATLMDIERHRLYAAVRALLELVAEPSGVLLVLDDMHWADDGSVELCEYLLRHPPHGRLALALAFRPRQVNVRLAAALDVGTDQRRAEIIELGPLEFEDAAALMPADVARSAQRRLYRASGGNPFYLDALLRSGDAGPVQSVLVAELATLGPVERTVAHAAAVVGDAFEPDLVAEVAEMDLDAALTALDELVGRDLVRAAGAGSFQFRHPLVRAAGYESAGAAWRVAAHQRAAAALGRRGAPVAARAHHVERAGSLGDEEALGVLVEAATAAVHTAPATAVHWLRAALRLLPEDDDLAFARLGLLGFLARALGVTGQLQESRAVLHQVLVLLPPEMAEQRAQTVTFAAQIEQLLGRHAEARALLLSALDTVADPHGPAAATLAMGLASARMFGGDATPDRDWAGEALAITRRLGDGALLAAALGMCAAASDAAVADRPAWVQEAAVLVDALADGDLAGHLEAAVWLAWGEMYTERFDDAVRHLERGLRLARETGQNHLIPYLLMGQGSTFGLIGRLAEAADCFDDALEVALLTGSDELRTMSLALRCWITVWSGDVPEAVRLGEAAVAAAAQIKGWYTGVAHAMLAQARIYAGEPAGCIELVTDASGGPELTRMDMISRPCWYELFAYTEAGDGRAAEAQAWAQRATDSAVPLDLPVRTGFAQLAQAHAAMLVDPAEAARWAVAAAESFETRGDRVDAGRAHLQAATAYAALGETELARERFAQARTLFEACGAGLFLEHTAREQRRMNARRPRKGNAQGRNGSAAPAGLTERELQIGGLVAVGMTNRQIAERLYLSPRTVETHLTRLFAKLGVASRAAAAHVLSRPE
jgi:DNA-binding CsgD family transcriptional regulator